MSALRKPKPINDPENLLTEAEQAFCQEFIASVRLKPTNPRYWANVQEPYYGSLDDSWYRVDLPRG